MNGSPPSTNCWSNRWNNMLEFKCTWARHKCGTAVAMSLQGVQHCRRPQSVWIRMPGCGEEEGSQTTNKGSECWASQWAMLNLCKPSSCPPPRSTRPSTNASSLFRTCRARGSSSSSALTPVQRTHCGACHPMKWLSLLQPMTQPVGSASQSCWAFPGTQTDTVSPVCHLTSADVGCRALGGPVCQHIGPVGRTACE